jgi:hypothetical protein
MFRLIIFYETIKITGCVLNEKYAKPADIIYKGKGIPVTRREGP